MKNSVNYNNQPTDIPYCRSSYEINMELIGYFIDYLAEHSSKSQATLGNIRRDLNALMDYLHAQDDADIHAKYISRYINHLEEKYMESSFISKLSSIRQFVNWLNLDDNPFWKLRISMSHEDFNYYSEDELLANFEQDFDYDHLVIRVIYELYLSIEELVELNIEDYNLASSSFSIRGAQIVVSDKLRDLMRTYLKTERDNLMNIQQSVNLQDPLFICNDERISSLELQKMLQKYQLKNIYIKRSRILNLLETNYSPQAIEKRLAIKLSNFYRPWIKDQDYRLAKAYEDYHPRANSSPKPSQVS